VIRRARADAGFTLVEVLVALLAMAILSGFAWQAMDGLMKSRDAGREVVDRTTRMATVLTQWERDLLAVHDSLAVPALAFDGQTLRLTRRVDGGVALVAWSVRGGVWQRWAGPAQVRVGEWQESWLRSQQMLGNEPGHVRVAEGASEWQIYFHRGNEWSNAQSSGDLALPPVAPAPSASGAVAVAGPAREALPNAVRLVITLDGRKLTRDIALGPGGA
jgi:general secretion pathway protein J